MPSLEDRLASLEDDARQLLLDMLDDLSCPLDRRALEKALGRAGVTRAEREVIVPKLLDLNIIVLRPHRVRG